MELPMDKRPGLMIEHHKVVCNGLFVRVCVLLDCFRVYIDHPYHLISLSVSLIIIVIIDLIYLPCL